jgi:multidrug efflux pump subunit AcrB
MLSFQLNKEISYMVSFALKKPYYILVGCLMILVLGFFTMSKMALDILPTFRLPAVMVVTSYVGMPAKTVETDISNRMERWLAQASGLDHIESRSLVGVSIVNCYFEPGFDPNNALAQISTLTMSELHYLPPGTLPPIVVGYDPTANLPVGLLTVWSPGASEARLWDLANFTVRNQANSVPGAIAPVVFGGKERQIIVYLDPQKLSGYGDSPMDVVDALQKGNSMIPTGDVKIGKYDYSVVSNGMLENLGAFDDVPIKVSKGAPVFIKDVGKATDASRIQTNIVQVDGIRHTFLPLFRRVGSSTLDVVANIKKALPTILKSLPEGSKLKLEFDQSPKIKEAIFDVVRELVVGVLLAAVVIYLFLGSLTPTLIASMIIPLSIIGGMMALYYAGQTLNLMTLGGLALITGPLIDKAVVAIENIERHLDLGASVRDAAEKGVSEVQLPVLMASLALIVVFFPVTFFKGLGKFLFTPMMISVTVTEIISYFAVMTTVPLLASRLFKAKADHHGHRTKIVEEFNRYFDRLMVVYKRVLDYALKFPETIITLSVLVFFLSLGLVPFLGMEFFPVTDHGQFYVRVRGENGTRVDVMADLVENLSKDIHDLLPKESVETVLGNTGVLPNWASAYTPNSASHDSLLEVGLTEHSSISANDAIKKLREAFANKYPNIRFSYSLIDPVSSALNYGALNSIDLRLIAPDLVQGQAIATDFLHKVSGVSGIKDAFIEQELDYPAIHIQVDRTKAGYLGLSTNDVIQNIITAMNSSVLFSPNFWDDPVNGNNYFIGAMYPEKELASFEAIENIPLLARAGSGVEKQSSPTLLRNVAQLSMTKLPVEITHYNIQRTFDIMANVEDRDIGSVASDIDKIVSKVELPPRFSVGFVGQVQSMRDSFGNMGVGMILSMTLIFLLMLAQLESWINPLLILATVPMGFIGVFVTLFVTNTTINIQSLMGMIMLIGIVVSNTVIIVDFANQRMTEGVAYDQAIREAGLTRIRPILMTAISAMMALLPSSLSGANAPLARAVIGGLISSTFLSLVFLPSLFVFAKRKSRAD